MMLESITQNTSQLFSALDGSDQRLDPQFARSTGQWIKAKNAQR
jgi:hypothetical protein